MPARRTASRTANAPKSTAENGESEPWNFPMAVRQAEMMTVSFIVPPVQSTRSLGKVLCVKMRVKSDQTVGAQQCVRADEKVDHQPPGSPPADFLLRRA